MGHYGGGEQQRAAAGSDIGNTNDVSWRPDGASIEIGSWVAYAAMEEIERHHAFIAPAVEVARITAGQILRVSVKQEGL